MCASFWVVVAIVLIHPVEAVALWAADIDCFLRLQLDLLDDAPDFQWDAAQNVWDLDTT